MNKLLRFLPVPRDLRHAGCESEVSMKFNRLMSGKHFLLALVAMCGLFPAVANADCRYLSGPPQTATITVPHTVTVPRDSADGTIIYRSSFVTISHPDGIGIECDNASTGVINYIGSQPVGNTGLFPIGETGLSFQMLYQNASTTLAPYGYGWLNPATGRIGFAGTSYGFALVKTGPIKSNAIVPGGTVSGWKFGQLTPVVTMNISNSITVKFPAQPTCKVSTPSVAVALGTIKASTFTGIGATSPSQSFKIGLSCEGGDPNETTAVSATLTDQTVPGNRSDQLSLTPASTAKGVALQVLRDTTVLKYGADSSKPGNENQWRAGTTGNGTFDISLAARYIQTAAKVTPGSANAKATITMSYQ